MHLFLVVRPCFFQSTPFFLTETAPGKYFREAPPAQASIPEGRLSSKAQPATVAREQPPHQWLTLVEVERRTHTLKSSIARSIEYIYS